jgi:hypothetical protein
MGASSVVRIPRLSLLLLIGMAGAGREAIAEPPACFPERTVMISAQVYDEQGHVFAGLRAGHRVRIIDDFVGKDFDRALVEIDEPVRVRGFVNRVLLHAFPRHQLEVLAGKRWWMSGVALNLHQGDSKTALATRAELHDPVLSDGTSRILLPGVTVACADLDGAPPTITERDDCYGAVWSSPDHPQGRSMHWRTEGGVLGKIEEADSELLSQVTPHPGQSNVDYYLIRRAGKRALIDIWDWSGERTRTWVPSELLRDGRPSARRTFTEKCKCCPASVSLTISADTPRVRLRSEAQVRLAPRAWLFVRVASDKEGLVARARIRASIDGTEVGRCLAPAGACFIHDIPVGQEVLLEAMTPEGNGQAITNPRPDAVTEITVPLP